MNQPVFAALTNLEHAYHMASIYAAATTISTIAAAFMFAFSIIFMFMRVMYECSSWSESCLKVVNTSLGICVSILIIAISVAIFIPNDDTTRDIARLKYKQSTGIELPDIHYGELTRTANVSK